MARTFHHPLIKNINFDRVLHALSDPMRRNILFKIMGCDGMNCANSCENLPPSTISFHYRVLRNAGLIHSHKKGVEVINTARKGDIERRFPGLLHTIFQNHKATKPRK